MLTSMKMEDMLWDVASSAGHFQDKIVAQKYARLP